MTDPAKVRGEDANTAIADAPRVLVVDDEPAIRDIVSRLLSDHGYHVDVAGSGDEAIARLAERRHAVMLLDLMMPGLAGLDVLRHMQQARLDTKVIVLSGDTRFESARDALLLGAYDFVGKPYRSEQLLASVSRALRSRSHESARKELQTRMEQSDAMLRFVVHNSPDLVFVLDQEGRFVFANERFRTLLGHQPSDLVGRHYLEAVAESDGAEAQRIFGGDWKSETPVRHAELRMQSRLPGSLQVLNIEVSATSVFAEDHALNDGRIGLLGIGRDVTERRGEQVNVQFQAYHDLLTRLPNRALFRDRLSIGLAQAQRNRSRLAVLFLDLDRFKAINDSLGHAMGDRLLKAVANRLAGCVRRGDTLSRYGGDEFTLLLPEIRASEDVAVIAKKILDELSDPFLIDGYEMYVGASIGIAVYPEAGENAQTLMQNSDIAMYQVKAQRKGGYAFFTEEMVKRYNTRLSLERELKDALASDQLEVHYLPCVRLSDGRIDSVEALLRWRHPRQGLLLPSEFLPIAEESGLVVRLDEWLQRRAFADVVRWRNNGVRDVRVSVNVSSQQVDQARFVERFERLVRDSGADCSQVIVEITESTLCQDLDAVVQKMAALRSRGASIAIDDFGTGLSSLSYLQHFPADVLKIDRSFVQAINGQGDDGMVAAISAMAGRLGFGLVAEGVENRAQLQHLRRMRLARAQGFLFSKPAEVGRTQALLEGDGFKFMFGELSAAPIESQPRQ